MPAVKSLEERMNAAMRKANATGHRRRAAAVEAADSYCAGPHVDGAPPHYPTPCTFH